MREFLQSLFQSGQVTVPFLPEPLPPVSEIAFLLQDFDAAARLNLAGQAPALNLEAAYWAASLLMQACRFLISREVEPSAMEAVLKTPCPLPRSPEVNYSVDLFFQYLPELYHFAKRLAQDDPLVKYLEKLAGEWPLSSVAMETVATTSAASVESIVNHPCLAQLYADRIIAHQTVKRLGDPRVDRMVRMSYGAFPELCPVVSGYLEAKMTGGELQAASASG